MVEKYELTDRAALNALDSGMRMTKNFDPDIAKGMVQELLNKFPPVIEGLPNNVGSLTIETNQGTEEIPRQELQNSPFDISEKAISWTWGEVYAYYY